MPDRVATTDREDDLLVAEFLAGTPSGLDSVYRAYGASLYTVAFRVLGNEDDASDCVHDALLRMWQRARTYRAESGPLRAYLLVSVRNEALTRKRNAARHVRIEESLARDGAATLASEIEASDPVARERLRHAIAALPNDQRIALELAYFGHLTYVQVADKLGAPLGTVKSRIALALRKLGAALADERGER